MFPFGLVCRAFIAAGLAVISVASILAAPATAAPDRTCGSGYSLKKTYPIDQRGASRIAVPVGYIKLYANAKNSEACAVAVVADAHTGKSYIHGMSLTMWESSTIPVREVGDASQYYNSRVGPLYLKTPGYYHCVSVWAWIMSGGTYYWGSAFFVMCDSQ
ncbi:hypothetical protein [Streptosporangium lutulentum]|uniref:Spore-associated protein A n=1 Tax=Streptosporangium lutulentum TaxID=1461250 RepID=A0ABT9QUE5_9ACTN|nr:hypothetical protein [Streptosporangium lutulentum]